MAKGRQKVQTSNYKISKSWGNNVSTATTAFQVVQNSPANAGAAGDTGLLPGSGRAPGGGQGKPLLVFLPAASLGQRGLQDHSP